MKWLLCRYENKSRDEMTALSSREQVDFPSVVEEVELTVLMS